MGWRIDKGEWILYSKDNYDKMRANELKYQKSKEEKKRSQVYKKFRKDYEFKRQAKEIFEEEERQRKEEAEWE